MPPIKLTTTYPTITQITPAKLAQVQQALASLQEERDVIHVLRKSAREEKKRGKMLKPSPLAQYMSKPTKQGLLSPHLLDFEDHLEGEVDINDLLVAIVAHLKNIQCHAIQDKVELQKTKQQALEMAKTSNELEEKNHKLQLQLALPRSTLDTHRKKPNFHRSQSRFGLTT